MVIPEDFDEFRKEAFKKRPENKKLFNNLRRKKDHFVDDLFHKWNDDVFAKTDCLDCANCCKTTGPHFTRRDIERISKHFKVKPGTFVSDYLRIDEDNDYVLKQLPCPFLEDDNYCGIYDVRPKACAEFPHTDHKNMKKLFSITERNVEICPAVFEIVEGVKSDLT